MPRLDRNELATRVLLPAGYRRKMDEARALLARLERVEALDRANAPPEVLLDELRRLVVEAEAWTRAERSAGAAADAAIDRLREAVEGARDVERTLLA